MLLKYLNTPVANSFNIDTNNHCFLCSVIGFFCSVKKKKKGLGGGKDEEMVIVVKTLLLLRSTIYGELNRLTQKKKRKKKEKKKKKERVESTNGTIGETEIGEKAS